MKQTVTVAATRSFCRKASHPIALVMTMGALHEGHAALIRKARKLAGKKGTVVVTIFVNPKQFNVKEDLNKYPQSLKADLALCKQEKVDLVFHPSVEEMYSADHSIMIQESLLSLGLCGKSRSGHFEGALTIITKVFNIVTPDIVVFGEKDWQQLALVRRLVRDFNYPIHVVGHPTVREKDHLALSSRNLNLDSPNRMLAPHIYQALEATVKRVSQGEKSISKLLTATRRALQKIPNAEIDYIEIVDEETLQPLSKTLSSTQKGRLMVAVKFGAVRLIDNLSLVV